MGLEEKFYTKSAEHEIEITLIGTGGGYGESIVIKIANDWILIDSCVNPNSKENLSANYLKRIGVDLATEVKLIICTHWHQDHIKGLSNLLGLCKSAKFVMPAVNDKKKFLRFITLDGIKSVKGGFSSTEEFAKCLQICIDRNMSPIRASSNKLLYRSVLGHGVVDKESVEICSLSPSESVISHFDKELGNLLSKKLSIVSVPEKDANDKSVVILLNNNGFSALLGADLEVNKKEDEGWLDIINNSLMVRNKVGLFKIPHHGSENGYDVRIFEKFISDNAILKLTPWNRSVKLPDLSMMEVYRNHSDEVFITSPVSRILTKPKKRSKQIQKMAEEFSRSLSEMKFEMGIVRSRVDVLNPIPVVETFGNAIKIP